MSQPIVVDANQASRSVRLITEFVENIGSAATTYKQVLEDMHNESDLKFLSKLATSMGTIESNVKRLTANLVDIQAGLNKYINQVQDFSEDMSGLRG
jgi:hypothetical protein